MSDLNEASQGPSVDSPVSGEIVEALTPETPSSLDDDLSAVWDKATGQEEEEKPDEATDQPTDQETPPVETPEEPAATVDFPSDLPTGFKSKWGELPEDVRDTISSTHRDLNNRLSTSQREVSALKPIRGALEEAIKSHPHIRDMMPEQIAQDIPRLVQIGQQLEQNPVQTLIGFAQQKGVLDEMAKALTGQAAQGNAGNEAALSQHISRLEKRIEELSDPARMKETYASFHRENTIEDEVSKFASEADSWGEVEGFMPQTIPLAQNKLGENASARSVLEEAHKMAIQLFLPEKAPKPESVEQAETAPDPAQVQKAQNAKSVNVKARSNGKARAMTLDEELSAVWDKAKS